MSNQIAPASGGDGWETLPDNNTSFIRGQIIKFNSGEFQIDKTPLASGTEWIVTGVLVLWVFWKENKPADYKIAGPDGRLPDREELSHQDRSAWPLGLNNEPSDPWRNTRYVYLINAKTAADATFTTDSIGGHKAVGELGNSICNMRLAQSGAVPIVRLVSMPMKTRFGIKTRPGFEIVTWKVPDRVRAVPTAVPPAAALPWPTEQGVDEDIPF
jgi:hypothetical protein